MWGNLAFGGSLLSLALYDRGGMWGPVMGIVTAFLFMLFGYFEGVYMAILSNVIFLGLHSNNLRKRIMTDEEKNKQRTAQAGQRLQREAHGAAKESGWWTDLKTGEPIDAKQVVPEKLMLIVSEVAEGMEGHRKSKMDDHLPHREMLEVELADALIRIYDLGGALGFDLGAATAEKMEYNRNRPDHKLKNRQAAGGKKY